MTHSYNRPCLGLLLLLLLSVPSTWAKVRLPAIISDHMVLQQRATVRLWGWADAGEQVSVQPSWSDKAVTARARSDGRWEVRLKTPAATTGQALTISGADGETLTVSDVLIGEVWLCTGQSNMEFPVCDHPDMPWITGMDTEEEELRDADYPDLRLFRVEHQYGHDGPVDDCTGQWLVSKAENLYDFSAIGFVFGRRIHRELGVPVGMVQCTFGGTHAESWMPLEVMERNALYADVLEEFALKNVTQKKGYCKVPATLWNGMVHPILGYTVRGNIWYQGESNAIRYQDYQQVFTDLIKSWRKEWGQDMPFYFMQIAPHKGQPAGIREAQLKVWQSGLKDVGMSVVTDACDSADIHPRNKRLAGERMALWALAKQYDRPVACSGPVYKSLRTEGDKAILSFDHAEGGLHTPGGEPVSALLIAGADRRFYPATATIRGSELVVSAQQVPEPLAVRFGWSNYFHANLFNEAGLPAVPFRTDDWDEGSMARWMADSEMARFPQAYQLDHGRRLFFGYAQGVGCCAMLRMWHATGERRYYDYVKQWADSLINRQGDIHLYDMAAYNLDFINSGKVLFDLYRETDDARYRKAMDTLIRQLRNQPRTLKGGFWHKLVYQHQMWLDGLYMASPFMAQYGAEFGQTEWIDEAVRQFRLCHLYTYDKRTGLYRHGFDESRSQRWADVETGQSPCFWGRSIGWWMMAMVDALDFIPEGHDGRDDILGYLRDLAEVLPRYQDSDGLWYQVLDQPKRKGNFPEASVTAQCMYAYAKAVNRGYIDVSYRAVAEKALRGLREKLLLYNEDGTLTLTRCCQVGGLGGNPYRDGSFEYYIGEKMRDNDAKATGPFIMGCLELERTIDN